MVAGHRYGKHDVPQRKSSNPVKRLARSSASAIQTPESAIQAVRTLIQSALRQKKDDLMPKRSVSSDRVYKSRLPFAHATIAGDFMFVCCVGANLQGKCATGDARAQTQQCIDNIKALLEEAGAGLRDVVKCTVYVTDRAYWEPMNEVYFANFAEDPPHRVSCIVNGLGSPDCLVEIDATAYLGKAE
jgi:enamine deaminase RidA (YjgF/YER057c/UK114 family)